MQGREHEVLEVQGEDGTLVQFQFGQMLALTRLQFREDEQMTGRHLMQFQAERDESGINRAIAWRWAGEEEWQPLPFATPPEPGVNEE